MKKKAKLNVYLLTVVFLLLCMIGTVLLFPAQRTMAAEKEEQGENRYSSGHFYYEPHQGYVSITGYLGREKEVTIPSTISGKPVSEICSGAFDRCNTITSIIVPDTVMFVADDSFTGCASLETIVTYTVGVDITAREGVHIVYMADQDSLSGDSMPDGENAVAASGNGEDKNDQEVDDQTWNSRDTENQTGNDQLNGSENGDGQEKNDQDQTGQSENGPDKNGQDKNDQAKNGQNAAQPSGDTVKDGQNEANPSGDTVKDGKEGNEEKGTQGSAQAQGDTADKNGKEGGKTSPTPGKADGLEIGDSAYEDDDLPGENQTESTPAVPGQKDQKNLTASSRGQGEDKGSSAAQTDSGPESLSEENNQTTTTVAVQGGNSTGQTAAVTGQGGNSTGQTTAVTGQGGNSNGQVIAATGQGNDSTGQATAGTGQTTDSSGQPISSGGTDNGTAKTGTQPGSNTAKGTADNEKDSLNPQDPSGQSAAETPQGASTRRGYLIPGILAVIVIGIFGAGYFLKRK